MTIKEQVLHNPDDLYKLVGIIYDDPKNIKAKIQILGSQAVFICPIREVYENKAILERLPKTQSIFVGVLYYAEKQGDISKYKGISLSAMYHFRILPFVSMFFITVVMLSNLTAVKMASFWCINFNVSSLFFPLSYVIAGLAIEVYGYKYMRRLIWGMVLFNALFLLFIVLSMLAPVANYWSSQVVYTAVLTSVPINTVSGIIAGTIGFFVTAYIMAKTKILKHGGYFKIRFLMAAFLGKLVDGLVFFFADYGLTFSVKVAFQAFWASLLFSSVYFIVGSFLVSSILSRVKAIEKIDCYDINTNFNPFSLKLEDE